MSEQLLKLDDWEKLKVIQDGDSFAVVGPDFINLQLSPAVWITPHSPYWKVLNSWFGISPTPQVHLPLFELVNIIYRLNNAVGTGA
jgi:hypothetical protein